MQASLVAPLSVVALALTLTATPMLACVGDEVSPSGASPEAGADGAPSGDAAPGPDASAPDAQDSGSPCVLATGISGSKVPTFKSGVKADMTANGTTLFKMHGGFTHDGEIYLYGGAPGCAGMAATTFGIVRYTANGDLDTNFGTGGIGCMQLSSASEPWTGARDPKTGRIVLAGTADFGAGNKKIALVCLKADGTADTSCIGGTGNLAFALDNPPAATAYGGVSALAVAFDAAGRILLAGGDGDPFVAPTFGFVARLDPTTGTIDPTFNSGKALFVKGVAGLSAMLVDGDAILVAGTTTTPVAWRWRVSRFLKDGSPDEAWGTDGSIEVVTGTAAAGDVPRRMVSVPTHGSFAVAGLGGGHPALNVIASNGQNHLSSYAATGATWNLGYVLDGLAVQCDGKLLLGAWSDPTSAGDFVTRFDPVSGKVDGTFAGTGSLVNLAGADNAFGSVMFDDKTGTIVVATNHANTGVSLFRLIP